MDFENEYISLGQLGTGAKARVYKVKHRQLGYIRALRVLNQPITSESDPLYLKFQKGCQILLRLGNGNHPNIVHGYKPKLIGREATIEMDYVAGESVGEYLKDKKGSKNQVAAPVHEVIRLLYDISSALAYCHSDIYKYCFDRGEDHLQDDPNDGSKVLMDDATRDRLIKKYRVIHNDIHANNIIRSSTGPYVLVDFDLAIDDEGVTRSSLLENGAIEYKAPEKWACYKKGESELTPESDIYSFGVVLYEFLTGRVPFPKEGKTLGELENAHRKQPLDSIFSIRKENFETVKQQSLESKDYPEWLETVIYKCLEKKPEDRFRDGKELFEFVQTQIQKNDEQMDTTPQLKENDSSVLKEQQEQTIAILLKEMAHLQAEKGRCDLALEQEMQKNVQLEQEKTVLSKEVNGTQQPVKGIPTKKGKFQLWTAAVSSFISGMILVFLLFLYPGIGQTSEENDSQIELKEELETVKSKLNATQKNLRETTDLLNYYKGLQTSSSANAATSKTTTIIKTDDAKTAVYKDEIKSLKSQLAKKDALIQRQKKEIQNQNVQILNLQENLNIDAQYKQQIEELLREP